MHLKAAALAAAFLFYLPYRVEALDTVPAVSESAELKTAQPELKPDDETPAAEKPAGKAENASPSPRRLKQHSLGLGLGQTFLLGKYADYGENKISADLFYSYAASYSFDVLVGFHHSSHEDEQEKIKLLGLTASIKSRLFEFDNFSPFVLAGLGFYAPRADRKVGGDLRWSDEKITFGLNFGGGVDLRLNDQWTVGGLGQLHWPFAVEQDHGSDLKGYYFKLLLTLAYSF